MALQQTNIFSNIVAFTRASSATYFDSTGKLRTATTNTPRFDYNPVTLALRGILVEEQRTNLVTYSEDFNNSAWSKTRSSIAANAATSPSGAFNADKLIEDTTATNFHGASFSYTATNVILSFSVFAKAAERTHLSLQLSNLLTGASIVTFNLSNGTISTGAADSLDGDFTSSSASISSVGNGWYRCTLTSTKGSVNSNAHPFIQLNNGSTTMYTGNGTSGVFIWGAQLEVGAFPTSYIPSSVTFSGRTSDGTYFDSTGTLRTAGSGVARTTYTPSNLSADPFLLLEESRTNSVPNNTMVGAAAGTPGTAPTGWIAGVNGSGLTIQLVGTGTENGIAYVDYRFSGTTSSATEFFVQPVTGTTVAATNGQTWTGSFYVRAVAGSITNINNARVITRGVNSSAALTIGTGSDVKDSLNVSSINLLRPATTVTTADAATTAVQTYFGCGHGSGVAIDITLRIGMPQLELGAYATSVITTSSAAVTRSADTSSSATATRSADVASINTLDPWYNFTTGTLFVQGSGISDASARYAASINDNTLNEFFGIRTINNLSSAGLDDGIVQWGLIGAAYTSNNTFKSALAYATNDIAFCVGAAAPATDATATLPTVSQMQIGAAPGLAMWNGHIHRVTYYPRRLTNAELQALTT